MPAKIAKIVLLVAAVLLHGYADIGYPLWANAHSAWDAGPRLLYVMLILLPSLCFFADGVSVYRRLVRAGNDRLTAAAWGAGTAIVLPCFLPAALGLWWNFGLTGAAAGLILVLAVIASAPSLAQRIARPDAVKET